MEWRTGWVGAQERCYHEKLKHTNRHVDKYLYPHAHAPEKTHKGLYGE